MQCVQCLSSREQLWCGAVNGSLHVFGSLSGALLHSLADAHSGATRELGHSSDGRPRQLGGITSLVAAGAFVWSAGVDGICVWEPVRLVEETHHGYLIPAGSDEQYL